MAGMPAAREVGILSPNSYKQKKFHMYTLFWILPELHLHGRVGVVR
jgi:hypothetical protein